MTTKNIVPRADGEGELGTSSKKWSKVQAVTGSFDHIQTTTMTSEIYSEGSTKFGDTSDDTHTFTGSAAVYSDNGMTLQATSSTPSGSTIQHDFLTVTNEAGEDSANFIYRTENPFGAPAGVLIKTLDVSASAGTDIAIAAGSPDPIFGTGGSVGITATSIELAADESLQIVGGIDLGLDSQNLTVNGNSVVINAIDDASIDCTSGDVDIKSSANATLSGSDSRIIAGPYIAVSSEYFLVDGKSPSTDGLLFYARPSSYGSGHSRYTSFGYDTTYDCSRFTAGYGGAGGDNQFIWYVSNDTDSEHPVMFLDFSGNLGIGTTTPAKTLDVVGNISASQEISASSFWGDGSNLSGITATETDTLATVTARGATTTTPVYFNTHITASSGINSGPLHVMGSSVHSGTIDMYAGGGLYFFGNDGTSSGSLFHSGGGLLLGGEFGVPVGIMAPNSQAFMSNGAASVEASGTDVNITPNAAGKVAVAGVLSASLGITASSFVGDGSGLTGVTGEWDGTHDGNAEITGSLTLRDSAGLTVQKGNGATIGSIEQEGAGDFMMLSTSDIILSASGGNIEMKPEPAGSVNVTGEFSASLGITGSEIHAISDLYVGDTGYAPKLYRRAASMSNSQHKANYLASEDYVSWYSAYGTPSISDPMLTNTFYLANIRWEISSSDGNAYKLFDNDYAGGPLTIASGSTLPVSVTFTGSNQVYGTSTRGITYPQGFFIASFLGGANGVEDASQFDVTLHYSGGLTQTIPESDMEMIAANSYNQNNCWKINLTSAQNYLNKVELNVTANSGTPTYFTEFEYFQSKPASQSGWDFSGFTKYEDQTLYRKLSWNNAALAEVGSIDEDGLATMTRYKADNSNHPGTPTGGAFMYAVSGTTGGDMYVKDAGGNQTKISPHDEHGEWEYFSKNTKTGKVVRIRMEKMIRKLEELTGETFIEEE